MSSNNQLNNSNSSGEDISINEDKEKELDMENYKPPRQTALPFVTFEKGKFIISEEAKKLLSQKSNYN